MNSLYTPLELASQLGDLVSALTSQVTPFRSLRDLVADDGLVSLLHQELQSISDKIATQPASINGLDEVDEGDLAENPVTLEEELIATEPGTNGNELAGEDEDEPEDEGESIVDEDGLARRDWAELPPIPGIDPLPELAIEEPMPVADDPEDEWGSWAPSSSKKKNKKKKKNKLAIEEDEVLEIEENQPLPSKLPNISVLLKSAWTPVDANSELEQEQKERFERKKKKWSDITYVESL